MGRGRFGCFCLQRKEPPMASSGAINDRNSIQVADIENIVRKLCVSYADIRRSFLEQYASITTALNHGEVTEAIRKMAAVYRLPSGFPRRVGYSAHIQYPAGLWTAFDSFGNAIESVMYFKISKVDLLYIHQYLLMHMIAHELAHARMQLDKHSLQFSEFATDVLAVLVTGNHDDYHAVIANNPITVMGYIRQDLVPEVFRCLHKYADRIYLK